MQILIRLVPAYRGYARMVILLGFGWISNVGKAVELPKLFFHPELRLPKYHAYGDLEESFEENCKAFLDSYAKLLTEEESGRVAKSTIFQVVSAAWRLKKDSWELRKRPEIESIIKTSIPDLVRKYGVTRIWKAGYPDTFQRRIEEQLDDDTPLERRYHCGRCGRELTAKLSVQRGIGPICWHKRGL
jgi:hypothetical protein